jgi:hypothetical protein
MGWHCRRELADVEVASVVGAVYDAASGCNQCNQGQHHSDTTAHAVAVPQHAKREYPAMMPRCDHFCCAAVAAAVMTSTVAAAVSVPADGGRERAACTGNHLQQQAARRSSSVRTQRKWACHPRTPHQLHVCAAAGVATNPYPSCSPFSHHAGNLAQNSSSSSSGGGGQHSTQTCVQAHLAWPTLLQRCCCCCWQVSITTSWCRCCCGVAACCCCCCSSCSCSCWRALQGGT